MSDPIFDVPHVIGVDDVHSAELVSKLASAHNRAIEHFKTEHPGGGRDAGRHALPVVPSAVARWNPPTITTVDSLSNGAGSVAFSIGFAQAPKLAVGRCEPFFPNEGYFLRWESARPIGRQHVQVTAGWSGSGNPTKYLWEAHNDGEGAIFLASFAFGGASLDVPIVPNDIRDLAHVTLVISEVAPIP